jgi:hypothetical protein
MRHVLLVDSNSVRGCELANRLQAVSETTVQVVLGVIPQNNDFTERLRRVFGRLSVPSGAQVWVVAHDRNITGEQISCALGTTLHRTIRYSGATAVDRPEGVIRIVAGDELSSQDWSRFFEAAERSGPGDQEKGRAVLPLELLVGAHFREFLEILSPCFLFADSEDPATRAIVCGVAADSLSKMNENGDWWKAVTELDQPIARSGSKFEAFVQAIRKKNLPDKSLFVDCCRRFL